MNYFVHIFSTKSDIKKLIRLAKKEGPPSQNDLYQYENFVIHLAKYNFYDEAMSLINELDWVQGSRKSHVYNVINTIQPELLLLPIFEVIDFQYSNIVLNKPNNIVDTKQQNRSNLAENIKKEDISKNIEWAYSIEDDLEKLELINHLSIQLASSNSEKEILSVLQNQIGKISKTEETVPILYIPDIMTLDYYEILDFIRYEDYEDYEEAIRSMYELNSEGQNEIFFQKSIDILPHIDNYQVRERFINGLVYKLIECKNFITALELLENTELKSTDTQSYIYWIARGILEYFPDAQELVTFLFHSSVSRLPISKRHLLYKAIISAIPANNPASMQIIAEIMPNIILNKELLEQSKETLEKLTI